MFTDTFVREVPGSDEVKSWTLHEVAGSAIGAGFMVYGSAVQLGGQGTTVSVFFPLEHRTLRFTGTHLAGNCCLNGDLRQIGGDYLLTLFYGAKEKFFEISP